MKKYAVFKHYSSEGWMIVHECDSLSEAQKEYQYWVERSDRFEHIRLVINVDEDEGQYES